MIIGAFGDVHRNDHLGLLRQSQKELGTCDLLLLAGDITDDNSIEGFGEVLGALKEWSDADIVAVFGNEEYEPTHAVYRERYGITFLEEAAKDYEVDGIKLRIVGSTGALDRPTWWQRNNVPDIGRRYRERVSKLDALLQRNGADVLLLLTHYAPTYATLEGEKQSAFPEMGSLALEGVIMQKRPDLALHAHAHRGKRYTLLTKKQRSLEDFGVGGGEVPIYNVSLPANGRPSFFDIQGSGAGVQIRYV